MASNLKAQEKTDHHGGSKIIVSCYLNGENTLKEDLYHLVARMEAASPDIVKLVIEATDIVELDSIFHLLSCSQVQVLCYKILFFFFFPLYSTKPALQCIVIKLSMFYEMQIKHG